DPTSVWKVATVTKDYDGRILVVQHSGDVSESLSVNKYELPPLRNPDILIGSSDLSALSYLHEPAILQCLANRFVQKRVIYTYSGIVLVAINPYCELQIYGNDQIANYRGKGIGDLDPHVYALAEEAFRRME
ncbi:Myosin 5, partial [Caligus rogercresseyi]